MLYGRSTADRATAGGNLARHVLCVIGLSERGATYIARPACR